MPLAITVARKKHRKRNTANASELRKAFTIQRLDILSGGALCSLSPRANSPIKGQWHRLQTSAAEKLSSPHDGHFVEDNALLQSYSTEPL